MKLTPFNKTTWYCMLELISKIVWNHTCSWYESSGQIVRNWVLILYIYFCLYLCVWLFNMFNTPSNGGRNGCLATCSLKGLGTDPGIFSKVTWDLFHVTFLDLAIRFKTFPKWGEKQPVWSPNNAWQLLLFSPGTHLFLNMSLRKIRLVRPPYAAVGIMISYYNR